MAATTRSAKNPGKKTVKKKSVSGGTPTPPENKSVKKKTAAKKTVKKKTAKKTPEKKPLGTVTDILYPEYEVRVLSGEDGLTADTAKTLLGWREEQEDETFEDDYLLVFEKRKVQCAHNTGNRPLSLSTVEDYVQDMLQDRWQLNGETISIGKKGMVVEGQHRLVALILADSRREGEEPLRINATIVFGVEESDEVVNTINTGKVRSLSDVIYRSEILDGVKGKTKERVAKILDSATSLVQSRSSSQKVFGYRKTLSESLEFIQRHKRLVEAARYIFDETDDRKFKLLSPGYCAGLFYLMATSLTDPKEYRMKDNPDESFLDFTNWDIASDFWTEFIGGASTFEEVEKRIRETIDETGGSRDERLGIIIKAWECYVEKKDIKKKDLLLTYSEDEDGFSYLNEFPALGGIDNSKGEPVEPDVVEEKEEQETKPKAKAKRTTKKGTKYTPAVGELVTVTEEAEDVWEGIIDEVHPDTETAHVLDKNTGTIFPDISWLLIQKN